MPLNKPSEATVDLKKKKKQFLRYEVKMRMWGLDFSSSKTNSYIYV